MAQRFFNPAPQFFYTGTPAAPLSGGLMYFYITGTDTPKDTYSDSGLSVPNSNPVVLDSSGVLPNVFLNGAYKVVLKDKTGIQQPGWPRDVTNSIADLAFSAWDSTATYGDGGTNIVYASDSAYYVSIQAANTNHDPTDQPSVWWSPLIDVLLPAQQVVDPGFVAVGDATTGLTGIDMSAKGALLVGDGTTAPRVLTVGANGTIPYANSAQATGIEWAAPPTVVTNIQTFAGSGTWTKPAGATSVLVELWGGGGGGAGQAGSNSGGGGGGGYSMILLTAAACAGTEAVTIGAGGAGGTASVGSDGGSTTFGSLATARGGQGGQTTSANALSGDYVGYAQTGAGRPSWASGAGAGASGGGAADVGGDCIMGGAGGGGGSSVSPGNGGTSANGGSGGAGRTTAGTATAGTVPGGGGGGARNGTGGAGAAGQARITAW